MCTSPASSVSFLRSRIASELVDQLARVGAQRVCADDPPLGGDDADLAVGFALGARSV
ncbi:MAG: hypothetical protein ACR2LH_02185 [Thermoleophilaceae bacterium]